MRSAPSSTAKLMMFGRFSMLWRWIGALTVNGDRELFDPHAEFALFLQTALVGRNFFGVGVIDIRIDSCT